MKINIPFICMTAGLLVVSLAPAASIPFENDFSSVGFSTESGFSRHADSETYRRSIGGDTQSTLAPAYGTEQFDNHANKSFTSSVQFNFTSQGTLQRYNNHFGFALFGSDPDLSGGAEDPFVQGIFRFGSTWTERGDLFFAGASGAATSNGNYLADDRHDRMAIPLNTFYTLVLDVENTGANSYDMTLSLFDAAGTTQLGTSATATGFQPSWTEPSGGFYLGLRTTVDQSGGTTSMVLDNFAVIPEPSTLALLGIALVGMMLRHRRRIS